MLVNRLQDEPTMLNQSVMNQMKRPEIHAIVNVMMMMMNLPVFADFLCFHRVMRNSALASDMGTNTAYFGWVQAAIEN